MKTLTINVRSLFVLSVVILFWLVAFLCLGGVTQAGTIAYPDQTSLNVLFTDISESSVTDEVPLFGQPHVVGSCMTFMPLGFASSSLGAPGGTDIVDGNLHFTVQAKPGEWINGLSISEAGDYTLIGPPGAFAHAGVSTPVMLQIEEVGGQPLLTPIVLQKSLTFTPANGQFDFSTEGIAVGKFWSGQLLVDFDAILAQQQIEGAVTRVQVNLDNVLATTQGIDGGAAFIAKKSFMVDVTVPEPSSFCLALLGFAATFGFRRRSK